MTDSRKERFRFSRELNVFEGLLIVISILGFIVLFDQSKELKRTNDIASATADLTRQSIDLSAKQFELSERPWISADLRVIEDLKFDKFGVGGIGIEILLHNKGKTPALNTRVIQYLTAEVETDTTTTVARIEGLCGPLSKQDINLGNTVFPDVTERMTDMVRIGKNDIETAITKNGQMFRSLGKAGEQAAAKWAGRIAPSLITCIDYRSSSSPTEHHQTRYYSHVGPRTDDFSMQTALAPTGVIRNTQLWRMFYGQYAD